VLAQHHLGPHERLDDGQRLQLVQGAAGDAERDAGHDAPEAPAERRVRTASPTPGIV
jgi:hypothetical protein